MSSHGRPCYSALSDYTKNGYNPIIAPTLATTTPQLFSFITPHNFNQTQQNMNRIHSVSYAQTNCADYKLYKDMCEAKKSNQIYENYTNESNFISGFNDISINKNF